VDRSQHPLFFYNQVEIEPSISYKGKGGVKGRGFAIYGDLLRKAGPGADKEI
jgi:hypothetical protein